MISGKRLSVILPSFNDARVVRAIRSIHRFDDIDTVRIVVVDGRSSQNVLAMIRSALKVDDILISEPDDGIFDALNKGLDASSTDYIGWLGSDDVFTGDLPASDVIKALSSADVLVADALYFRDGHITRVIHGFPSRLGLSKLGLHNPHFSTFGSARLFKSERFDVDLRGSDIDYFLKIFAKKPLVKSVSVVATLAEEGGFSNSSVWDILRTNMELVSVYARHSNWIWSPVPVLVKVCYKLLANLYFKTFRMPISRFDLVL